MVKTYYIQFRDLNHKSDFPQASLEEGLEGQLGGADFLTALPPDGWDKDKVVEEVLVSKMLIKVNEIYLQ